MAITKEDYETLREAAEALVSSIENCVLSTYDTSSFQALRAAQGRLRSILSTYPQEVNDRRVS